MHGKNMHTPQQTLPHNSINSFGFGNKMAE